ncbi:type II 3-dehydroquinate dehydratase [Corynebacterium confusum]|uniref:type II 3-dehydroquinate dehydratase n=1 Tax=Corynebacterium confusum TaxID=71254 RepID=UPI0025B29E65|nr:type II 3-dehydroquinate dehydratase [Corynebacterium confusum]WJY89827.1 3-dehydroquinate dehydratase [Corynebacterium confusum]
MQVVIINGPNLNRLGKRQPDVYGTTTLHDIEEIIRQRGEKLRAEGAELELDFFQSNHEGEIIDRVHAAADAGAGVIINPGAFTHTSVAIRDALAEIADGAGFVEVHLSNVHAREEFRQHSYLSAIARGVIAGLGPVGYLAALEYFAASS